jgi:hypothetical protein
MDKALALHFSHTQLRQINTCRLYLQVLALSDILKADGRHILTSTMKGIRDTQHSSTLLWPNSRRPQEWQAWILFLKHYVSYGH